MNNAVIYGADSDIAVVRIDHPPVNALSDAVKAGIIGALNRAAADPAVRAVILTGSGRGFSAGADITEFEKPPTGPTVSAVNHRCETLAKPVVAAIHGWTLGGGLEVALSCHARVASPDAKVGLPELKLGIIPGAGGTQRLTRIVGPETALRIIVTGTPIGAARAAEIGIIDRILECDLLEGAKSYARELADGAKTSVAVRDREDKLAVARSDPSTFEAYASELTRCARGLDAPLACIKAVRMALDTPFDEALDRERAICVELMNGLQSKAQRHLFFAERKASKVAGLRKDVKPRDIRKAAVVGAGTMACGIAMSFANAGIPVAILEVEQEALDRGLSAVRSNYDVSVRRGSITADARDQRMALVTGTTRYEDLKAADIIIEALFEHVAVKKHVFGRLDKVAKSGVILISNTCGLDINEIAAITARPADVLGMHFFSPADVMRLLEIVPGGKTAPDVLATAISIAKRIGKLPVVVGACRGLVSNRMRGAQLTELEHLLLEGALPEQVDKVCTDFGFPIGPFDTGELDRHDPDRPSRKPPAKTAVIGAPYDARRFGQKTGKGRLHFDERGFSRPVHDPCMKSFIGGKPYEAGLNRRDVTAEEIIERTIYPMISEGACVLEKGIAARSSDIDIVCVHGYGFPIGKGGPMFWADHEGLPKIVERLQYWYDRTGRTVFEPAPLLKKLAESAGSFAGLEAEREAAVWTLCSRGRNHR